MCFFSTSFKSSLRFSSDINCTAVTVPTAGELGEMLQIHLEVKRFQALLQALIRRNFFFHIDSSSEGTSNEYIVRELYLRQPSQVAADADEEALESEIAQFEKVSDIDYMCCIYLHRLLPFIYCFCTVDLGEGCEVQLGYCNYVVFPKASSTA